MPDISQEVFDKGIAELKTQHDEAIKELQKNVLEKSAEGVAAANKRIDEVSAAKDELQKQYDLLEVKMKEQGAGSRPEHFNDVMEKAIEENAEKIKNFKGGSGERVSIELKAVGDMTTANFTNSSYANITTDYRQSVLPLPTERIWMRNVLPSGTTESSTIWYPKHTGGEGGANTWASGNKAQMDFDFTGVSDAVRWIAGFVKVPREMLDDVSWLQSFLRANMLLSLYKKENQQILNGDNNAPNLKGIIPQASAYDGDFMIGVERIVDAGYGQVNENEGAANLVMLHPRDAVAIILNKASGSGEYDLPPGTIGFINNKLTIAGMTVVQTKEITKGQFLTGDNTASQFVTRLSPEIQMFDSNEDDAKKNLVMFRIEERAALATYYPTWWVKGALVGTT